ncbi:FliI/YscN family ATPase [Myxococcota bacterium]|nr:FliI/YscN family ATPase [Myxococcota bacterium]MBU1380651.1 FliI/YscN family ATPase [Myxococcota bacterium]MBU1495740.1 FliI/YscN family ATPase [Myxococcota bacterium]
MSEFNINRYLEKISEVDQTPRFEGRVRNIRGILVEGSGHDGSVGDLFDIETVSGRILKAEVVGIKEGKLLLMPLGETRGISENSILRKSHGGNEIKVGDYLLGRVIGPMGNPIDGKSLIPSGNSFPVWASPPLPLARKLITEPISLGIKVIDSMLTIGRGQRIGIFAGAGVGKSTLLGSIVRNADADVFVIGLIGERGREVGEFLERHLGPEGMEKTVIVVSSSDDAPPLRLRGAAVATAIAEGFRAQGKNVLLMMDSLTRFAMAGREMGLAAGEPPTTKGYTPSVFAALPRLLERPGVLHSGGSITAIYTVLVEGDDMSDPIADASLAILDGHILLSRQLAQQGQYPPVDVGRSVSRLMNDIATPKHLKAARQIRHLLSIYHKSADLVSIGAYSPGSDPMLDLALKARSSIQEYFRQEVFEKWSFEDTIQKLEQLEGQFS